MAYVAWSQPGLLPRTANPIRQPLTVDAVRSALLWLDNWPAGLKLNTELSHFYCHTFIGFISVWSCTSLHCTVSRAELIYPTDILEFVEPHLPAVIYFIGLVGWSGLTMSLSLVSDLLSFLTLHLYLCYLIATAIFSNQLSTAGSLWNLFRGEYSSRFSEIEVDLHSTGKRYNVLRNRIDSWDYDIDQLLFGTILFTLVAFLFPTVLVYYVLFASVRVSGHLLFSTSTDDEIW